MTEPLWLSIARAFLGLQEIPGKQSNPVILRWAKDIGAPKWYEDDDQAWCAVFMNRVLMAAHLPLSGADFALLRATSFRTWGRSLLNPVLGSIMTFSRPEGAHVGFYLGESVDAYRILGGNQGNAVSETWITKNRLTSIRWPLGVDVPVGGPLLLAADGSPVSKNEA